MTESQIVRQILDYLAAEHIFAFRLNTSAIKIGDRFFRAHSLGPGAADLLAIPKPKYYGCDLYHFLPAWIECKTTIGKQSPEQKSFQQYVESLGHDYILARSVDDIRERVGGEKK